MQKPISRPKRAQSRFVREAINMAKALGLLALIFAIVGTVAFMRLSRQETRDSLFASIAAKINSILPTSHQD
jgi:DMSO/TMAO reductase YedYZ heme-binding membrane subunit